MTKGKKSYTALRRQEILRILHSKPKGNWTTIEEIYNSLPPQYQRTTLRTIRRDIDFLYEETDGGIETQRGVGGGVRCVGGAKRSLSYQESQTINKAIERAKKENLIEEAEKLQEILNAHGFTKNL
ncbi:MAG: hypothetical protein FWD48_09035 [Oscillospiraceae bacterium]|nr:hypothetical protein [Oscillospiraceae bacterium]